MASFFKRVQNRLSWQYLEITDPLPFATRDLSWKVRWRMRNDRNPLFIVVQDKYKGKEYASERGVRSADQYFVTDNPDTIPFDTLPDNCFIKANHGCKWNIYRKDGEFYYFGDGEELVGKNKFSDNRITREQVVKYCKIWLSSTYSKREWAYGQIPPRIIIEEVLEQRGGGELIDYRFFTFHGVVKTVYIDSATFSVHNQKIFVDRNWQEVLLKNLDEDVPHVVPEKPQNFEEMLGAAERLGSELDFARIDLYDTTRGVTLGEISVYPMGGASTQPTPDREFNKWLADQWILPDEKSLVSKSLA